MNPEIARHLLLGAHAFLDDPNLKEWEGLSREDFVYLINSLFESENFLDSVGLLEQVANEELQASSIPPDLENLIKELEQAKDQEQEIRQKARKDVKAYLEKRRKAYFPLAAVSKQRPLSPKEKNEEEKWQEINEDLGQKIQEQLLVLDPSLEKDPQLLQHLTEEVQEKVVGLALTEENKDLEQKLSRATDETLTNHGYFLNKEKQEAFSRSLLEVSQKEIQEIQQTIDSPLSPEILQNYSQGNENVAFPLAYILLNPSLAAAYAQKAVVALPVKLVQQSADETSPEWQKMLLKGVFAENYDLTIQKLKNAGTPDNHPTIIKLQKERDRLYEAQKTSEGKDKPLVGLLKTFFKPQELLGQQKGVSETTGISLSGKTLWSKGTGWAFNLKNTFNNFGLVAKIYRREPILLGKTTLISLTSKTSMGAVAWANRRVWRKAYLAFAKTAAGQAVKTGIKKASVWVATKLGVRVAVSAAAAGTGVGLIPTIVINVAIEVVSFVWNKAIKPLFQKISTWIKEPDKAFATLMVGVGVIVFVPALTIGGALLVGIGALGLLGSAGSILGGLAIGTTSFFAALTTGAFATVPVGAFVVGVLGTLSALTFFIVMTTAGAFILPQGMGGTSKSSPPITATDPECNPPRNLAENTVCVLRACNIQFVTMSTLGQTENCLRNSSLLNKETILAYYKSSVEKYTNLQCVGFVQGIMAALGKPLEGRDAKNYALVPAPAGYSLFLKSNSDINQVQVGDLPFWTGGDWGHIMMVVAKNGNTITISNALGNSGYVGNGQYPASVFDGYLRPN